MRLQSVESPGGGLFGCTPAGTTWPTPTCSVSQKHNSHTGIGRFVRASGYIIQLAATLIRPGGSFSGYDPVMRPGSAALIGNFHLDFSRSASTQQSSAIPVRSEIWVRLGRARNLPSQFMGGAARDSSTSIPVPSLGLVWIPPNCLTRSPLSPLTTTNHPTHEQGIDMTLVGLPPSASAILAGP